MCILRTESYITHFICKPQDITMQEFTIEYLNLFPLFNANPKLPMDKLLDVAGYAILEG